MARRQRVPRAAALLAAAMLAAAPGPVPEARAKAAHTIAYDDYSYTIDGKRLYVWSGEFHYWRLPSPAAWRDVLQKMKAGGFNATSVYFDWGFHSPAPGEYDFSGIRDVDRLLDIAEEVGIYVIARPGPYINAETDGGGFPGWLTTQKGRARSTAPDYLAASQEWLSRIDAVIARHQLTDGRGTVIAYQVENELYTDTPDGHAYIRHLAAKARADGITVPLLGNHKGIFTRELDIDGYDRYPQEFDCSHPDVWSPLPDMAFAHNKGEPLFLPEFQGGAFDPWGGVGYDKCRQLTNGDFEKAAYENNIASGSTMQNFYMVHGGTSWGYLPAPGQVYSSYDYGAPISEDRRLTEKYLVDKRLGYMVRAVAPLTRTDAAGDRTTGPVLQRTRRSPGTGTVFTVVRHRDVNDLSTDSVRIALGGHRDVPVVVAGRDSKLLVADYPMDHQRLEYSTSEIMTHGHLGSRDVALLYGRPGQPGRTVLRYAAEPKVTVPAGDVRQRWADGTLRLDYTHRGLARVLVEPPGGTPLLLLLADDATADTFWRQDTARGPVLVRGPELVRTARYEGGELRLTGDTDRAARIEVFDGGRASLVTWNGRAVTGGRVPGPAPVTLPRLAGWRFSREAPEARPAYDDSGWRTAAPTAPAADDNGFHAGSVWYRGHFTGGATGVRLAASTGRAGEWLVWLNGRFLGDTRDASKEFRFPAGAVRRGGDNVLSVLTVDMGHDMDFRANDSHKKPRGLTSAALRGSTRPVTWRVQGGRPDPVRGPLNAGGLYGERRGFHLPSHDASGWRSVTLPYADRTPGVSWYRTSVGLALPAGQDVPLSLVIARERSRHYRALIYVNGWMIGQYVSDLGPQQAFHVPSGLLRTSGRNSIAFAVINADARTGGLGRVTLRATGNFAVPPGWG